ncbi:kielin/chordin-like protein [Megachile rotundata]|uniref:kielin/chordin-like protein n=1 Tax=Megachile rotundata TaxID=143995 RepID=UPI003FD31433
MMARIRDSCSFVQSCVLLALLVAVHVAGREICDQTKCPGPLRYYKDLGCKPVYNKPDDCCPKSFNCDHLKSLSKDKCYANGHEYNIGEELKDEDKNPCDFACKCMSFDKSPPSFICAAYDCAFMSQPNCYYQNSYDSCCPGPYVCLKEGEERPTCEVDGKIYKDGESFSPKSDPELDCYCKPGYKGENVEPFCKKPNRDYCSPLFRNAADVHRMCAPVFYDGQNPQKDCSVTSRCQNANDTVIHNHDSGKSLSDDEESNVCIFGDMKMHVGDELNQGTDYDSVCVKCVCEVPPFPTCQRLPYSKCNDTLEPVMYAPSDLESIPRAEGF